MAKNYVFQIAISVFQFRDFLKSFKKIRENSNIRNKYVKMFLMAEKFPNLKMAN